LGDGGLFASEPLPRPNIVWIVAEDASPHIGCFGETAIKTPNLDRLAGEGIRFANAFTTAPVCSTSRSALITGMYQTALGAHNHRSQHMGVKGGGNVAFYESYRLPEPVRLVPQFFKEAGYFVSLQGKIEGSDTRIWEASRRASGWPKPITISSGTTRSTTTPIGGAARRTDPSLPRSCCAAARTGRAGKAASIQAW